MSQSYFSLGAGYGHSERAGDTSPSTGTSPLLPYILALQFRLPGQGKLGLNCGDTRLWQCEDCLQLFIVKSSCNQRECPECYGKWALMEARKIKERLWQGLRAYNHYHRELARTYTGLGVSHWDHRRPVYRIHHIIISLPKDYQFLYEEQWIHVRRYLQYVAKCCGLDGGCIIYHPTRESSDSVYDVHGPHFHLFGIGHHILGGSIPYAIWDTVVKRIPFNAKNLDPYAYVLEHCGILKGRHAVVWFGLLAYNKFAVMEEESYGAAEEACPFCGSLNTHPVYQDDWTGGRRESISRKWERTRTEVIV
jgi:hypothetical protein